MKKQADRQKYILWLGPIVDEATLLAGAPALSPAANRWQHGLLTGVQNQGVPVSVLGHLPESLWPKGALRIARKGSVAPGLEGKCVPYLNLPFWRPHSLKQSYKAAFRALCHEKGVPTAVLTYNDSPWNASVGLWAQEKMGIPWICVIADAPGSGPEFIAHEILTNRAAGRVFLSWGRYRDCGKEPRLHLDGGISGLRFRVEDSECRNSKEPIVLFTGAMTKWAGVGLLIESFRAVKNPRAELWLCGPGKNPDIEYAGKGATRIKFLGLVGEDRLQQISRRASLFVNPRPSSIADNRSNFPSKVLEYLSYGKPVISTWTDGLSPEYRNLLIVPDKESPSDLAGKIEEVLSWSNGQRSDYAAKVGFFLESNRLWSIQAVRLLEWLETTFPKNGRFLRLNTI